jgi:hypothetical protein
MSEPDDLEEFYEEVDNIFDGPNSALCTHGKVAPCGKCDEENVKSFLGPEKYIIEEGGEFSSDWKRRNPQVPVTLSEAQQDVEENFQMIGGPPIDADKKIQVRRDVAEWLLQQAEEFYNFKQTLKGLVK